MFSDYPVGTRIKNLRTQGDNAGKYGEVVRVTNYLVHVRYDDGQTGQTDDPVRYYKIIERAETADRTYNAGNSNAKPMNTIVKFVKNLALSSDERLLRKYGLKTECGEYTQSAKDIVINKLCADNEATLVEMAKAFAEEEKANKED